MSFGKPGQPLHPSGSGFMGVSGRTGCDSQRSSSSCFPSSATFLDPGRFSTGDFGGFCPGGWIEVGFLGCCGVRKFRVDTSEVLLLLEPGLRGLRALFFPFSPSFSFPFFLPFFLFLFPFPSILLYFPPFHLFLIFSLFSLSPFSFLFLFFSPLFVPCFLSFTPSTFFSLTPFFPLFFLFPLFFPYFSLFPLFFLFFNFLKTCTTPTPYIPPSNPTFPLSP